MSAISITREQIFASGQAAAAELLREGRERYVIKQNSPELQFAISEDNCPKNLRFNGDRCFVQRVNENRVNHMLQRLSEIANGTQPSTLLAVNYLGALLDAFETYNCVFCYESFPEDSKGYNNKFLENAIKFSHVYNCIAEAMKKP